MVKKMVLREVTSDHFIGLEVREVLVVKWYKWYWMQVVVVAMEDVLETIGEVFYKLFVDKEWQNLLVDVEEIFESLLSFQEVQDVLLVVGKFLTNKYLCKVCDSIKKTKAK